MKLLLSAVALLAIGSSALAQTTYSVIKVTAALPAAVQAPDFVTLVKFNFTSKALINIALDQDVNTPVPRNVILGYAGDFTAFGHHTPNTNSPVQLVVFDTNSGTKLKTIGIASTRTVVENRFAANKFKRVGLGSLAIQDTSAGATNSFFSGGTLQIGGTVTRSPNGIATTANLKVNALTNVVGTIEANVKKGDSSLTGIFVITKGSLRGSGKIVGTFTE